MSVGQNWPQEIQLATPDTIISAYSRCYEGIPAERIGFDIVKTSDYWLQVLNNEGLNVNKHVNGHRNTKGRDPNMKSTRGGIRVKKEKEDGKWYHEDAQESMQNFFTGSNDRFLEKLHAIRVNRPVATGEPQACMDPDAVVRDDASNDSTIQPSNDSTMMDAVLQADATTG